MAGIPVKVYEITVKLPLDRVGTDSWTQEERRDHADHLTDQVGAALAVLGGMGTITAYYPNGTENDPEAYPVRISTFWVPADGEDAAYHHRRLTEATERIAFLYSYCDVQLEIDRELAYRYVGTE